MSEYENLKNETSLIKYLNLLHHYKKQLFYVISSFDTPCGLAPVEIFLKLQQATGSRMILADKFRCPYILVCDAGEVVYENIVSSDIAELRLEETFGDFKVKANSCGFIKDLTVGCHIQVNGVNSDTISRGLNFAIFDKQSREPIDFVNFDTYSKEAPARRSSVLRKSLDDFASKCKKNGINYISFRHLSIPLEEKMQTENEKRILKYGLSRGEISLSKDSKYSALGDFYDSTDKITDILTTPKSFHNHKGIRRFFDYSGSGVNCRGGLRYTKEQPTEAYKNIFIFGGCRIFGVGNADEDTISSNLQKILNEHNILIRVYNYGFYLEEATGTSTPEEIGKLLNSIPAKNGDIIISDHYAEGCPRIDLTDEVIKSRQQGTDKREFFFDSMSHYTPALNELIAEKIFETLAAGNYLEKGSLSVSVQETEEHITESCEPEQLREYKQLLSQIYHAIGQPPNCGAIVMNCNPFTNGHRYLIEQAASTVNFLFVFVVQEDKSFFPFKERYAMVSKGVQHLKNVLVVPSGQYILSSQTFSEYFNKAELQNKVIDCSKDVTVFAEEIAPLCNIKVRFCGEEPYDTVTKQYNESLQTILPQYGIDFVEIQRMEYDGNAVSASWVRKLLETKDWDSIAELVPETTLEFLRSFV